MFPPGIFPEGVFPPGIFWPGSPADDRYGTGHGRSRRSNARDIARARHDKRVREEEQEATEILTMILNGDI